MRTLDATVTRRSRSGDIIGPSQRVDVMTALKAMTLWPAYQNFEENEKGSIETGKLADFVILSADPTAVDPETIDQIKATLNPSLEIQGVVLTMHDARTAFSREEGQIQANRGCADGAKSLASSRTGNFAERRRAAG